MQAGNPHVGLFPKCPKCFSLLTPPSSIQGCGLNLLQCARCSKAQLLCGSCLYPSTASASDPSSAVCTNTLCPVVSTLLTCDEVSDVKSRVYGSPMFRACPKCHNLILHEKACKFVKCVCSYKFCFICLRSDCHYDKKTYWSLTCKHQRAERQRFYFSTTVKPFSLKEV